RVAAIRDRGREPEHERQEQHESDEHEAEDERRRPGLLRVDVRDESDEVGQELDQERAEEGAPDRPVEADDGADEQRQRELDRERVGAHVGDVDRVERPGDARERGGDTERPDLVGRPVDAGRRGRKLAVADRAQRAPEARREQPPREQEAGGTDGPGEGVQPLVVREPPHPHAVPGLRRLPEERDPGRPAGEAVELLQDGRQHDGDAERREREVEAREPQRRDPRRKTDRAGDRGRDGDRPHVPHAVVGHQNRGRVAADGHERAVPERDLAAVPGEDVEAEDGDEVRADRGELHRPELGQRERQHRERQRDESEPGELHLHARLTSDRPSRPAGRTRSTARMTASAVASRSSPPIQWTYVPARLRRTPSRRPPSTAPSGESMPPSTAAAKAYRSTVCIMFGSRKSDGAASTPATAPRAAASPQPTASIAPTRTPTSRASTGLTAAARRPSPSFVRVKRRPTSATTTSETAITPMSCFENATPPTVIGSVEKGPWNCFAAPPHTQVSKPLIAMRRPIVRMTIPSSGPRWIGLIRTECSATPPPNESTSVAPNAGQNDQPWSTSVKQRNAESVAISPCAKLRTPVERWMRTSASASEP